MAGKSRRHWTCNGRVPCLVKQPFHVVPRPRYKNLFCRFWFSENACGFGFVSVTPTTESDLVNSAFDILDWTFLNLNIQRF